MSRWDRIPTPSFDEDANGEDAATVLMSRGSEFMMRDLQERYQRVLGGDLPPNFEDSASDVTEPPVVDYVMLDEDERFVPTAPNPRRPRPADPPTHPTLDPPAGFPRTGRSLPPLRLSQSVRQAPLNETTQPFPLDAQALHTEPTLDRQAVPPTAETRRHRADPWILLAFCLAGAAGFALLNLAMAGALG